MIYTLKNLPDSFETYNILKICSNTLTGGGHVLAVGEVLPIIIGRGEKPKIWLQALNDPIKKEFVLIVENSISKHPSVKVTETDNTISITIQQTKILSVKNISDNSAEVDFIDLRPIGFNLYGDSSSMNVGNSSFTGNSMHGVNVLVGFGE